MPRTYSRQTRAKSIYRPIFPRKKQPRFVGTKTAVVVAQSRRRQAWLT